MSSKIKAGDLVFEISNNRGIGLAKVSFCDKDLYPIKGILGGYTTDGCEFGSDKIPSLLHATPENRQALVTLYGEDAVPKLPVRGSELTKKLLEKQKYVLCYVSDTNNGDCRENQRLSVIERFEDGYFYKGKVNGPFVCSWKYAVPVDMNGNEITEIE